MAKTDFGIRHETAATDIGIRQTAYVGRCLCETYNKQLLLAKAF